MVSVTSCAQSGHHVTMLGAFFTATFTKCIPCAFPNLIFWFTKWSKAVHTGTLSVFWIIHCYLQMLDAMCPRSSSMVSCSRTEWYLIVIFNALLAGIDDDRPMHPKSPHPSAPDGIATLLHKMERQKWLKRFLDVEGTERFSFRLRVLCPTFGRMDTCFDL
jgi:hypothetical protein